jgi:hypothetical protein
VSIEDRPSCLLLFFIINGNPDDHHTVHGVWEPFGLDGASSCSLLPILNVSLATTFVLLEHPDCIVVAMGEQFCREACNANALPGVRPDRPRVSPQLPKRPVGEIKLIMFGGMDVIR